MYTYAFMALQNRIESIPQVKLCDWYLGQDRTTDKSAMVPNAPAVFVEFTPSEVMQAGRGIQYTETSVTIRLVTSNIHDDSKRINKVSPSDHMAIFDSIYNVLSGYSAKLSDLPRMGNGDEDYALFNSLARNGITPPHSLASLMQSQQRFKGLFYDYSNLKKFQRTTAKLKVCQP